MSKLKISKGGLRDVIELPASKSYANRALVLAAIKRSPTTLKNLPSSSDVTQLVEGLRQVGLRIEVQGPEARIEASFPDCETNGRRILVGEGGTTARFLASLLLRGRQSYTLALGERLAQRPWSEFVTQVRSLGGEIDLRGNELTLRGPLLLSGKIEVDCGRTTQFASGLQMAFSDQPVEIIPVNMSSSQSYWRMTEDLIQRIRVSSEYTIPLDWSSASYPLAFGALNQEISFPGLHFDEYQADAKFLGILEFLGAIDDSRGGIRVRPLTSPRDVLVDVTDCLDLVPTLGYFLSHVPGKHVLRGVGNLAHKESDRLGEVVKLVRAFGRACEVSGTELTIFGSREVSKEKPDLTLPDDHRMVMAASLFLLHHNGGTVSPAEAVGKSYSDFFDILRAERSEKITR